MIDVLNDCGEKRQLISSWRASRFLRADGSIVEGKVNEIWSTCGRRKGHAGEHGPGSRVRRFLRRFA
jgi:hypothetical protein